MKKPSAKREFHSRVFKLVYEDRYIVVVDKESGFLTLPNYGERNTVLGALEKYFQIRGQGKCRIFIVHRLDRDTSGLLVVAKSKEIANKLIRQFSDQKPKREYLAIVAGHLKEKKGTFKSHLVTDKALNQKSTKREGEGALAVTEYQVEREFPTVTSVRVWLKTGKRNQIRVHFSEAGHPVLGDQRYGKEKSCSVAAWKTKRLALHAAVLGFTHPVTHEDLVFRSSIPREFSGFFSER